MHSGLVKHFIFPLHEKIIGRKTFKYLAELEAAQWYSSGKLEELQFKKLKLLLVHAQQNIPFYDEVFAKTGFNPARIQSIEDFQALPLLSKDKIRTNLANMVWNKCPGGLHRYNTGGSSGEPLIFYFDRRRQACDAAARALTHRWWGIDIGARELYLWGSPLEITKQDLIKNIRDRLANQMLLSAFEISDKMIPGFVKQIRKFKPECIFGYPSTIALFCQLAQKNSFDLAGEGVRVIFSTAEVLYDYQAKIISAAFGNIPVVDGYGSREGGFISHECQNGSMHVMEPNVIVEYLIDGRAARPGEDGEIVVTHLDNWAMPFIRYRTGDVAQFDEKQCDCGRKLSIMKKIKGRTTDFVVTPDGRWQHALSLIYVIRDISGVIEFKIIQETVNDINVLIKIDKTGFPENGEKNIIKGIQKRMGQDVTVNIQQVNEIARDASGKYRYVVSKVAAKGFL